MGGRYSEYRIVDNAYTALADLTGQGAGVIAAISVKKNKKCRHTNIEDIQNELLRQGVSVFQPLKSMI